MSKKQTTKVTGVAPMPIIPEMVSVKDMVPCPWNKRSDKEKGVKDLADSIAAQGLLNPAIVRVHPSQRGKYEILAGERRWRACSTIWTHMPVVNKGDISDEHARQITTIENLQREDLTPIEQAEDIHELQALGLDNRAIASKLGKSVTWVAKRARLADLSPKWKKLIGKENGPFSKWAPAHFELIARYDAETQDELLSQHWWGVTTVADLEKHLGNMNKKLSTAPWKLSDETLIPKAGACSACQKRASCQPELFAGTDDAIEAMSVPKNDRCLDKACWGAKLEAYHQIGIAQAKAKHNTVLLLDNADHGEGALSDQSPLKKSTIREWEYEVAKPTDKKAVAVYVVDGKGAGSVRMMKPRKGYEERKPKKEIGPDGKAQVSQEDRQKALNKRRVIRFVTKLMMILQGKDPDGTGAKSGTCMICGCTEEDCTKCVEKTGKPCKWVDEEKTLCCACEAEAKERGDQRPVIAEGLSNIEAFALIATFGAAPQDVDDSHEFDNWKTFTKIAAMNGGDAHRTALYGAFDRIIDQLRQLTYATEPGIDFADNLCAALKLDREAIWNKVLDEIPVPKSWAKMDAKSTAVEKSKKRGKKDLSKLVDE